ncbi:MAG: type I restriction endonuclease subunit R [Chloroflexi bacterium]|nr:type I restriction endonuclease subunit R [Chloroflexota bacterium]
MSIVGQIERRTQNRVVRLLAELLGYDYLGDWAERENNSNIEEGLLVPYLRDQGYEEELITRALYQLRRAADNATRSLYDRNRDVYSLLRYGVHVKPDVGELTQTVHLIDWEHPERNQLAVAEEVTVGAADARAHGKRPDVVLYINGIAVAVLELKRSVVSVSEGIRQNLDNQKRDFIQPFFSTVQLVIAGNDTEGLRYGVIQTPEKYYLSWKEPSSVEGPLDRALLQLCEKGRLLEMIHDFIVFDAGTKKIARHNQYFGVRAAQQFVQRREGGIIWHTQGSGKSLIMVWLAKWIRANVRDGRVLIVTDRTELDQQVEDVFFGVEEEIHRTSSGSDLVKVLNEDQRWLICTLIQKFHGREGDATEAEVADFIADLKRALPADFEPKGELVVFVDECHRSQSNVLHEAMNELLPGATFIGFTGTPLLKADKKRSVEVFGPIIHPYKYDEAVADGVVLDLRYEARNIEQRLASPERVDQWFEAKTRGLTDLAKAQLKRRWGTMQEVLSSHSRLAQISSDILMDMEVRDRLSSGRGNALLVAGSIYQACKFYELFEKTGLHGKCAIVTSYEPNVAQIKGEESGEGETERLEQYQIYRRMLADWFDEDADMAVNRVEEFERQVKEKFLHEPGQMKLLIVVDMLLTGFDAPPATYLYIDKQMRDHGLFQAVCRVNRLDTDDKEYGYIVDYKDLFRSLEGAVKDYTGAAFDAFDREDVIGLLEDRLTKAHERLDEKLEAVRALCEPVALPRESADYMRYFCAAEAGNAEQLKDNEPKRLSLYKLVSSLIRAYADIASELEAAGYTTEEAAKIKADVDHFEKVRGEVKLASGDYIDMKMYEPAMRHLIDTYIQADPSQQVSAFDDLSLMQLIAERGPAFVEELPGGIRADREAVAETIENNVRRLIIDESPINPKYYERMSELLDALIEQRRREAIEYEQYLEQIVKLVQEAQAGPSTAAYPDAIDTPAQQALYDNLGGDAELAVAVDAAVQRSRQDGWRANLMKTRRVRIAIAEALLAAPAAVGADEATSESEGERLDRMLTLVTTQHEY